MNLDVLQCLASPPWRLESTADWKALKPYNLPCTTRLVNTTQCERGVSLAFYREVFSLAFVSTNITREYSIRN